MICLGTFIFVSIANQLIVYQLQIQQVNTLLRRVCVGLSLGHAEHRTGVAAHVDLTEMDFMLVWVKGTENSKHADRLKMNITIDQFCQ